jgi:hypothetical protein
MRRRRKLQAYGRYNSGMVDAEPVRKHLEYLRANGMGAKTIAARAGSYSATIGAIIWGRGGNPPNERVKTETAAKILAIQPDLDALAPSALTTITGSRRRLQALARMGWTWAAIGEHTGIDYRILSRVFAAGRVGIEAKTARTIRDAYDALWDKTPPAPNAYVASKIALTKRRAAHRGWSGPLDWEDIDADDEPVVTVDDAQVRGLGVLEDAEWLLGSGETPAHVTKALGRTAGSLAKLARHHNRPDIATRFYALDKQERPAA